MNACCLWEGAVESKIQEKHPMSVRFLWIACSPLQRLKPESRLATPHASSCWPAAENESHQFLPFYTQE